MPDLPPEAYEDHFHPPSIPTEVFCLHCQQTYESYLIEWHEFDAPLPTSGLRGFWCCPMPGCDGKGFGFDIHPVDPNYIDPDGRDMGQWVDDGCGSEDEDCECFECRWTRGEIDPDDMSEDELAELQERVAAQNSENDDDCECCTCGGNDLDLNFQDESACAIPLDDLLPVDEATGGDVEVTYAEMIEIEEKLGFRTRSDERASESSSRPPAPRRDHPPIAEDDIPF